jgi:tRNA (cmo5U34)-methyltransferase
MSGIATEDDDMTKDAAAMSAPSAGSPCLVSGPSESPPSQWSFELPAVASAFDAHVREQLPFYDLATTAVSDLVRCYLQSGGTLVDIGCSTGNISRACEQIARDRRARVVNVESSSEMASRFSGYGELIIGDACEIDVPECDVAVSFLTLAFMPPKARRRFLDGLVRKVSPGGAIIIVERVSVTTAAGVCRLLTQAAKLRTGVSPAGVLAKEVSIAGVLRPVDTSLIEGMGGWMFFAYGDFRGYVIEVPE